METDPRHAVKSDDHVENQPSDATSRRSFLGALLGTTSAVVAALLAVPMVRYLFYPLTAPSKSSGWTAAGSLSEAASSPVPLSRTLRLNQRDGGKRQMVAAQLPEAVEKNSAAGKAGFATIADISRERIRRVLLVRLFQHDTRDSMGVCRAQGFQRLCESFN